MRQYERNTNSRCQMDAHIPKYVFYYISARLKYLIPSITITQPIHHCSEQPVIENKYYYDKNKMYLLNTKLYNMSYHGTIL